MKMTRAVFGTRIVLLLAVAMATAFGGGCAAPPAIQKAQTVKTQAFSNYLRNNRAAWEAMKKVYQIERRASIGRADDLYLDRAIAATEAENKAPTITPDQVRDMYRVGRERRQKADLDTESVLGLLDVVRDKADVEFAKGQQLDAAIADYMAAGVDEALFTNLAQYLLDTALPRIEAARAKGVK